jgi:hypothetical protein
VPHAGWVRLGTVAVLTPLLLWPTLLNHHPYLFWDSYGYFTQGRDYWQVMAGFLGLGLVPPEAEAGWIGAAGRMLVLDPAIRSVSYSLVFWPVAVLGGFWLTVTVNAAVAVYTVDVALDRLLGLSFPRRVAVLVGLAALSSVSWFASYVMPDLFGGLMILGMAVLVFAWDRLAGTQRVALMALVALGASFHAANLPLALALVVTAAVLAPARRLAIAWRLGLPVVVAVLLLAGLGWLAFGRPSLAPKSPPFLLARQVEDGPTIPYLRDNCGREDWALCPHLGSLWDNAQDFLWSPVNSYWAWEDLRDRLRAEEKALVLRAALARPGMQLRASAANTLDQLVRFGLDDLVLGRGALIEPQDYWFTYQWDVPVRKYGLGGFSALIYATVTLSLVVILWAAWPSRERSRPAFPRAAWFLLAGIVLNAAVCGILSGPYHRYQARVAWLVPMLAAGLVLRRDFAWMSHPGGLSHSQVAGRW